MAAAHRPHVAGGKAGYASTGSQAQLRGASAACNCPVLRLHGEELALRVTRDADRHSRHVVCDVERLLPMARLHGTITGTLGLSLGASHVQPPTVRCGRSSVLLQFPVDPI